MSPQKMKPWGNYPNPAQYVHKCENKSKLTEVLQERSEGNGTTLAIGNGRSYGDSVLAQSGHAIRLCINDPIISADWDTGTITAHASASFAELLKVIVPKGWFFAITPGTKFVTLGGAIANDVHGKNHHTEGTFGSCIKELTLQRSNGDIIHCSRDKNSDLFAATISGLGLTGIILTAKVRLKKIPSNAIETTSRKFDTLEEFVALSQNLDKEYEYVLAWIDYRNKNRNQCRGIIFAGRHYDEPVSHTSARKLSIPFTLPISAINRLSTLMFNNLYFKIHARKTGTEVVHYDKFFYPLDNIHRWNRIYGLNGFQQYQCVIPQPDAISTIKNMLALINEAGTGSFLSALKLFGKNRSPGLNTFPMPGISLAIDFPQSKKLETLFPKLDQLVHTAGGRLYPAKDAHMRGKDFRRAYPNWETLEKHRDPLIMSRFWHKVLEER